MAIIDPSRAMALVGALDFTRVLGTDGERQAQDLIVAAVGLSLVTWQRESLTGY